MARPDTMASSFDRPSLSAVAEPLNPMAWLAPTAAVGPPPQHAKMNGDARIAAAPDNQAPLNTATGTSIRLIGMLMSAFAVRTR
jgi:hypothetical protein